MAELMRADPTCTTLVSDMKGHKDYPPKTGQNALEELQQFLTGPLRRYRVSILLCADTDPNARAKDFIFTSSLQGQPDVRLRRKNGTACAFPLCIVELTTPHLT